MQQQDACELQAKTVTGLDLNWYHMGSKTEWWQLSFDTVNHSPQADDRLEHEGLGVLLTLR